MGAPEKQKSGAPFEFLLGAEGGLAPLTGIDDERWRQPALRLPRNL
jgi:hypothetical protein